MKIEKNNRVLEHSTCRNSVSVCDLKTVYYYYYYYYYWKKRVAAYFDFSHDVIARQMKMKSIKELHALTPPFKALNIYISVLSIRLIIKNWGTICHLQKDGVNRLINFTHRHRGPLV